MVAVREAFKPEFLNRLDDVLVFDQLDRDDLARIVGLQLSLLRARLTDRRITLTVTDAARAWLADTGFDPVFGARPLRRLVQTSIGDPLARELLAGTVRDGDELVVDVDPQRRGLSMHPAVRAT
jgi:ATP-dependent Clp protease ATP-binding subunit ClpB